MALRPGLEVNQLLVMEVSSATMPDQQRLGALESELRNKLTSIRVDVTFSFQASTLTVKTDTDSLYDYEINNIVDTVQNRLATNVKN